MDGVSLKDFIKEGLQEVTEALVEFADDVRESGASPNPDGLNLYGDASNGKFLYAEPKTEGAEYKDVVTIIDFDIAITAIETSTKKRGVGIKVMSTFSAEGGVEKEVAGTSISRMKVSVPLRLPNVEEKEKKNIPSAPETSTHPQGWMKS